MHQFLTKSVMSFLAFSFMGQTVFAATYDNIVKRMEAIQAANPEIVTKFELGLNDQQQTIWGWKFESSLFNNGLEEKPKSLVVGVHHGNEQQSAEVAVQFAADLATQMKNPLSNDYVSLSNKIFYVIPVLNIGGYNSNQREEYMANRKRTDPNRDYPDPCADDVSFKLASTRALADFVRAQDIVAAATIHGYIGTFTFPWGTFTDAPKTLDHEQYKQLASYGAAHNGYRIGTHGEVIYPTAGAFEDWAYYELGIWSMLLELRRGADVGKDSKALLAYFAHAPAKRSLNNAHTGNCRQQLGPIRARP